MKAFFCVANFVVYEKERVTFVLPDIVGSLYYNGAKRNLSILKLYIYNVIFDTCGFSI